MESRKVILGILGFAASNVLTAFITLNVLKNKYHELADKEIDSVKKVYEKHFEELKNQEKVENNDVSASKQEKRKKTNKIKNEGEIKQYNDYAKIYKVDNNGEKTSIPTKNKEPYVISPEEFSESEYQTMTLIWYADRILADMDGHIIHDVEGTIGRGSLDTFGRYEDDTVYVRDDTNEIDYEIVWSTKTYNPVIAV